MKAESYWIRLSQEDHFSSDTQSLKKNSSTRESSPLFVLHPYLDWFGLVVEFTMQNSRTIQDILSSFMGSIRLPSSSFHQNTCDCFMLGPPSSWPRCVVVTTSLVVVWLFTRLLASALPAAGPLSSQRINSWDNFLPNVSHPVPCSKI